MAQLTKILIVYFFLFSNSFASILFEKDNIIITENDIDIYQKSFLIKNTLNQNQLIKEVFFIKKIISLLKKNKPEFIYAVDNLLNIKSSLEQNFILDIERYIFIKNDLIKEYYQTKLNINDISLTIINLNNYRVPMSLNDCITIDLILDLNEVVNFDKLYYDYIKSPKQEIFYKKNNKNYKICIDQSMVTKLESELIKIISPKIDLELKKFIYEK